MEDKHKKTAVITGATGGVGRELSACFIKSGMSLYLLGRDFEVLRSQLELKEYSDNKNVRFCEVDLNNEDEILKLAKIINKENRIDFLIHGAAFYSYGDIESSNISDLDRSYRVNVRAPYLLSHLLLPKLILGNGVIAFLNSSVINGSGKKNLTQYASTKSALKMMADCLRQEVNSHGVRVITYVLGKVATKMQQRACEFENISYKPEKMIQPKELAELIYKTISVPNSIELTDMHVRPSVSYE